MGKPTIFKCASRTKDDLRVEKSQRKDAPQYQTWIEVNAQCGGVMLTLADTLRLIRTLQRIVAKRKVSKKEDR